MTHAFTRTGTLAAAASVVAAIALATPGAASAAASAPELRADGYRLTWSGGPTARGGYELRISGGLSKRTERIRARSITPAPQSGSRVTYRVRARGSRRWSKPVVIAYRRPGFLGVSGSPATDDRRTLETMNAAGVKTVKQGISFTAVQPQPGERRWGELDARMAELKNRGFTVLVQFDGYSDPPAWAEGRPSAFRSFVAAAVRRYGPGTAADVTWFEPMNEPYFAVYARDKRVSFAGFGRDWVRTVKAGRKGNPDARFLMPANDSVSNGRGGPFVDWITTVRRSQPKLARYVDAVAVHPYTNGKSPALRPSATVSKLEAFSRIDNVYAQMRRNGMRVPVFITELGWATANPGVTENQYHPIQSQETQAAYLRETVAQVQRRRWVSGIWFFSWRDYGAPGTPHDSRSTMGLTGYRWEPKLSYQWFVNEIRRRGNK